MHSQSQNSQAQNSQSQPSDRAGTTAAPAVYRAAWILPISQPVIQDGFLRVVDGVVIEVGRFDRGDQAAANCIDLGKVAVLPKMVNAHTHLEFSDCPVPIGEPGVPLSAWIGQVIAARGVGTGEQRNAAIELGLQECIQSGTAMIGDIATSPSAYPLMDPSNPVPAVVSFAEVLGLNPPRSEERFDAALEQFKTLQPAGCPAPAISPHAPYSTPWPLIKRCVQQAKQWACALAMHVCESPDERELLETGTGPFAETLQAAGLWMPGLFPWSGSQVVVDLIKLLAQAPRALLVHGNDLQPDEIDAISGHANLSVVYCPRTHHFFQHRKHPVAQLLGSGVNVALGTDSRASNPDLSLWKEVQFLFKHRQDLSPLAVLEMATLNGALALGGGQQAVSEVGLGGHLSGGAGQIMERRSRLAELAMVPTSAVNLDQLWSDFAEFPLQDLASVGCN